MSTPQTISPSRFTELRKRLSLSQEEFATRLGVSRNYVSMLERGAKEVSTDSSIGLLFRVLEEARGQHPVGSAPRSGITEPMAASDAHDCRLIPVIGWAHAGEAQGYEEIPASWQDLIPTECRDERAFAVRLQGDSMEPRYLEGDLLILMPSREVYSGVLAVVRLANDGVIFRRLELRGDKLRLVPINPRYETEEVPRDGISWAYPVWGVWRQEWK